MKKLRYYFRTIEQLPALLFTLKWLLIACLVGVAAGSASAFFLISLHWVTNYREENLWIISMLPLGGLMIGLSYHYLGQNVVKGNNQIIDEILIPQNIISMRMTPLVLFGTLVTHLFGGSAGREGTAVQMGSSIADQFTKLFGFRSRDRKILLIMGISAGFASVFGTPLAGAVFAMEVLVLGRIRYDAILPSFLAALLADYVCQVLWGVGHTHYQIPLVPAMTPQNLLWAVLAGVLFGLAGMLFAKAIHFWGSFFKRTIAWAPLRPFAGGAVIALSVYLLGTTKYIGLGVPTIVDAFQEVLPLYDFAVKILYTSFTLGAGFKGGEVTPLFFTGATLGNALSSFIPLPLALLAGMGFVGVFSGATNTPLACTFMGIELFGIEPGLFVAVACVTAYLFSGHSGIYGSQLLGTPKHLLFGLEKGKTLFEIGQLRKKSRRFKKE
ncbi:voltage-gated chloride channel family protein [Cesiribacter sp. SM1]|uniref:voltage-gated chloride channel family protein n=1 Tax=Cesiribacter sp. SM1 TaxID=2861196 RepID=UPI001CD52724|nr:voltage-gated chloride channel family protein [Cesiribacter sp. SM1]